jgi:HemY protein
MRRVLGFLILAAILLAIAFAIGAIPGTLVATVGTLTISLSLPLAILALLVTIIVVYLVLRLIGLIFSVPSRFGRGRHERQQRQGDRAITRAMVAIAAADPRAALRESDRARRLLPQAPLARLVSAEANRLAGRPEEAEAEFRTLTEQQDSAFLGYRGLLRQAIDQQDWPLAADLARRAEVAHPGAPWLRAERARLALRTGSWAEALTLTGPEAPRAVMATAAAEAATDPIEALRLAKDAFNADSSLTPAALAYARRLRLAREERRSDKVVVTAWTAAPHPELAEFYLDTETDPIVRMKRAEQLAGAKPAHPETHLMLARAALAAKLVGEARRQADLALAGGLDQRRVWLLKADIEEAASEGPLAGSGEAEGAALRAALRRIPAAQPDPRWHCTACGTDQTVWHPACPACGVLGRVDWVAPRRGENVSQVALIDRTAVAGDAPAPGSRR